MIEGFWIRLQEAKTYGYGSRRPYNKRIRIPEVLKHTDPDPGGPKIYGSGTRIYNYNNYK
jgi:hypothetical protein